MADIVSKVPTIRVSCCSYPNVFKEGGGSPEADPTPRIQNGSDAHNAFIVKQRNRSGD